MFVKWDKAPASKVDPPPRAIQFRDPRYCVCLGRYLKPLEHSFYRMRGDGRRFPRLRFIGKGLSQAARAKLMRRKLRFFRCPVIISLDASKFDKHVSLELLLVEHLVYLKCLGNIPELRRLLSWQQHNHGRSSCGVRYVTRGKRMSGDMNTALGNCLLMLIMVSTFCHDEMHLRAWDIFDDGDDCQLIVEQADLAAVRAALPGFFLRCGMEIKVESISNCLEQAEWCHTRPVAVGEDSYRYVRDPAKVLSVALGGAKYFTSLGGRGRLVQAVGQAELSLNLGVPVLQEFALACMRNSGTTETLAWQEVDEYFYRLVNEAPTKEPMPVTDRARESFALAWGWPPELQIDVEDWLRSWSFTLAGGEPQCEARTRANWGRVDYPSCEAFPFGCNAQSF